MMITVVTADHRETAGRDPTQLHADPCVGTCQLVRLSGWDKQGLP